MMKILSFKSDKMSMLSCKYLLYQKPIRFFSLSFMHDLLHTVSVILQCGLAKLFYSLYSVKTNNIGKILKISFVNEIYFYVNILKSGCLNASNMVNFSLKNDFFKKWKVSSSL